MTGRGSAFSHTESQEAGYAARGCILVCKIRVLEAKRRGITQTLARC